MNWNKRMKIAAICVVVLIGGVLYGIRFHVVNAQFHIEETVTVPQGEEVSVDGVAYKALCGELMTHSEYIERYQIQEEEDADVGIELVCFIQVENKSDEEKKILLTDSTFRCDYWANGVDYFSLWAINGDDFDGMIAPGKTKKIGISTSVNVSPEFFRTMSDDWRVSLVEWPGLIEVRVPVSGGVQ